MNSTVLGKEINYSIYLPKSYDNEKTFPVLYLLKAPTATTTTGCVRVW